MGKKTFNSINKCRILLHGEVRFARCLTTFYIKKFSLRQLSREQYH